MEGLLRKFKLNVEALLDAHLHLNGWILTRLLPNILHDELLFLRDTIVVAIDHDVDEVAQTDYYTVVRLKLLLDAIERKVIGHVVSQGAGRLEVAH